MRFRVTCFYYWQKVSCMWLNKLRIPCMAKPLNEVCLGGVCHFLGILVLHVRNGVTKHKQVGIEVCLPRMQWFLPICQYPNPGWSCTHSSEHHWWLFLLRWDLCSTPSIAASGLKMTSMVWKIHQTVCNHWWLVPYVASKKSSKYTLTQASGCWQYTTPHNYMVDTNRNKVSKWLQKCP